jgi:hypothetical protein
VKGREIMNKGMKTYTVTELESDEKQTMQIQAKSPGQAAALLIEKLDDGKILATNQEVVLVKVVDAHGKGTYFDVECDFIPDYCASRSKTQQPPLF